MLLGLGSGTRKQNLFELGVPFDHPGVADQRTDPDHPPGVGIEWGRGSQLSREILSFNAVDYADKPLRQDLPIYMAAVNPLCCVSPEKWPTAWLGIPVIRALYERSRHSAAGGWWQRAGKSRKISKSQVGLITNIAKDRKQARREAAYQIGFYCRRARTVGFSIITGGNERRKLFASRFLRNEIWKRWPMPCPTK